MNIKDATKLSFYNRHRLQRAGAIGCYFCIRQVDYKDIREFADNGNTGICPHCSTDALLPDVTDLQTLISAAEHFFTGKHEVTSFELEGKTA